MVNKILIFIGIAVGVASMAGIEIYGTINQQNNVSDDLVLAPAAQQGSFVSPSGLGADLNKEQWHEDPYADLAQKIREKAGK
jgi:hypothetical protein